MARLLFTFLTLLATQAVAQFTVAKSYTGWDCCKPICANLLPNNPRLLQTRGAVRVCDKSNRPHSLATGLSAATGCSVINNANSAYLCDTYQPVPVSNDLSYGFAIQVSDSQSPDNPACCKCYQVQWLTGQAANKTMVVQIVTPGGSGGDVKKNDLIILTPGGGLGPLSMGCPNQYGSNYAWGSNQGGVTSRQACERLPNNLWGGCFWRWNWARGEINGWDIVYQPVECPSRLTDISGCRA
ncbi:glycoside hydrolase family 45 protein [Podospora australis]|uniref:cellulase n=1 Tax=Podospora australis TaxID=1536484 RepID=A0AAN6WVJ7_9PEZI|nr:glycoside hydrolase family 45 protein [Podospora australis]